MELCNALSIPRALRLFAEKRVFANCLVTDVVGDCVVSSADRIGDLFQVTRSNPLVVSQGPSWGIIIEKSAPTECVVQMFGLMEGIYTGLTVQSQLWVGTTGRLVESNASIIPTTGNKAFVQQMGIAIASDVVLLFPEQPVVRVR